MADPRLNADVLVIGGGPAGSAVATLLAQGGHSVIVLEKDVHPRDHVGESLTPSTNLVLERLGVLDKVDDAGFIRKPGAGWNSPRSKPWKFIDIPLFEFPLADSARPYTFNVERDDFDALLLRHAHEAGAKVIQGVNVQKVLFEEGRAVGVKVSLADGWDRELRCRIVVDASGRRSLIANQLGMRHKDPNFNQFCIYSWFRGVKQPPEHFLGYVLFYFIGLNQAWSWHIPLRDGKASMGVVVDKRDFQKSGKSEEEFFMSLVARNRTFTEAMRDAERIRPYWIEADYSYKIDRFAGPGWILVGDALRFVDPIFSSGVDVALFSALYAYESITEAWKTGREDEVFAAYQERVETGVDVWYDLITMFYRLQNLVTRFATKPDWREHIIRTLQGNPYQPETQARARKLLARLQQAYDVVMTNPGNLLRPWRMTPEDAVSCPQCLGIADLLRDEDRFLCRKCGASTPTSKLAELMALNPEA